MHELVDTKEKKKHRTLWTELHKTWAESNDKENDITLHPSD